MTEDKTLEGIIAGLRESSLNFGRGVTLLIKDEKNIFHDEILYCRNEESQKEYLSVLKKDQKVKLFSYNENHGCYHKIQILEETKVSNK